MPGDYHGPDGRCLVLKTPAGDWMIDGPSRNNGITGAGWTRTGDPPNITVRPSIGMGDGKGKGRWKYHGHLNNGVLEACNDSET